MSDPRAALKRAKRVVVKIGSSTLARQDAALPSLKAPASSRAPLSSRAPASAKLSAHDRLARAMLGLRNDGKLVVLVSSGAIALGSRKLGYAGRPKEMAKLQAAASAGQSLLMRAYEEAFDRVDIPVAQVLLTHADLADRVRANNARAALEALLDAGAVPILNENDAVAVEEIKFGDNDELSAMVTPLIAADVLVLLSDVPGLLDAEGQRVSVVRDVATEALPLIRKKKSEVGTGGMASKIEAARRATLAGAHVVIADASKKDVIDRIFAG
ncbi:MAG TPA: glutamate 5-kinase, partial [Labilithrix sp.]|nr:glutamate 5-kinase [Labilithrix sp.]